MAFFTQVSEFISADAAPAAIPVLNTVRARSNGFFRLGNGKDDHANDFAWSSFLVSDISYLRYFRSSKNNSKMAETVARSSGLFAQK